MLEIDLEREKVSLSMKDKDFVPPKKTEKITTSSIEEDSWYDTGFMKWNITFS